MDTSNTTRPPSKGPKTMNGANGAPKTPGSFYSQPRPDPLNGHAKSPRVPITSTGTGRVARWHFSIAFRLAIWYLIITILYRCPADIDTCDNTSPRVCKPYFQLKHAVSPHVEPYYNAYAAQYVDLVRPYYQIVDQRVVAPGWRYAKKHGAPRVEQARDFARARWDRNVQPEISKYQTLVRSKYDQTLGPHIDNLGATFAPYYEIARTNALQTYHELLLPTYQFVSPYARQGYTAASTFTTGRALPAALWTWNKTYAFLDDTVWPHLRVLYVENVEPQLVKIGKRLGRYNSDKKAVPKSATVKSSVIAAGKTVSSFIKPTPSVATSSILSVASSVLSSVTSSPTASAKQADAAGSKRSKKLSSMAPIPSVDPVGPPEPNEQLEQEDEGHRASRDVVAADLRDWQERYDKAAKEGAAEINDQVREIARRMVRRNAKITGKAVLDQLQTAIIHELVGLRRNIIQIVGSVNKESATKDEGRQQIVEVVRKAGIAIRDRAQNVRGWREHYEAEMQDSITKAAESHFTILQEIKELALQKIGMKWAWTDGITYKDWEKYHELKNRFERWKEDIQESIVSHPALEAAQAEGAEIEDEAMKLAANAAKELTRLRQVAVWKLIAGDDSSEFDSTLTEQAAEAATHAASVAANAVKDAKDSVVEPAEAIAEAVSSAVTPKQSVDAESSVLEDNMSTPPEDVPAAEAAASEADVSEPAELIEEAAGEVSSVVEPTSDAEPEHIEISGPDLASGLVLEEIPIIIGNATEPDAEDASPAPVELPLEDAEAVIAQPPEESLVPSATLSIKPALFGAAAQAAPSRQPILDDYDDSDSSDALESMAQEIKSAYSAAAAKANSQYSQALSVMSAQIHGTPEPAHHKVIASVTAAYSSAMASASSRMDDALKLASGKYYGTPTKKRLSIPVPTVPSVDWAQIEAVAAEQLNQGLSWAEEQYESAKVAVGLATPTPSTPTEHINKALDNAKHNYYAGVGVAHARYTEFLAAASSALSSLTATPTPTDIVGTASSMASVATESAASVASSIAANAASAASAASASAYSAASAAGVNAALAASIASESAASAASAAGAGASSAASAAADNAASAASVASESAASAASVARASVYSAASAAGENAASAVSVVSEGAVSAASAAGANISSVAAAGYDNAAAAADMVSDTWEVVVSRISIQVYGAPTPTPFYASVYSVAIEGVASVTEAIGGGAASAAGAAGAYAASATDGAAVPYEVVSRIVSELLVGKEPTFSESVVSRLNNAYATGAAAASSAAKEAAEKVKIVGDNVASAASDATEAVKSAVGGKDEL